MKQTLTKSDFMDAFRRMDRYDEFGYEALSVLFDYFEECDPDMELDVVAICCDYSVDTAANIAKEYDIDFSSVDPEDLDYDQACFDLVLDYLNNNTQVIGEIHGGKIVYCSAF